LGGLAGFLLYVGIFFAVDIRFPPANIFNASYGPSCSLWGMTPADVANPIKRVWFVGSAGQWRSAAFADPAHIMPQHMAQFALGLPHEFHYSALALMPLGTLALFARDRRMAGLLLLALAIQLIFYFNYKVWDIYVFYIPSYLLMAILAAAGLRELLQWERRWIPRRTIAAIVSGSVAIVFILLGAVPMLESRWNAIATGIVPFAGERAYPYDHNTERMHRIAGATVQALPRDAIVFTN
ncbi:MAG: hypothetical protein J7M34_02250, partial [Anaerolineae bacterium]|nr:hypothetical protein [Anaerolineae bacterium]